MLTSVGRDMPLDTMAIEGTNSIVNHMTGLAPYISWPLLSSRILVKKATAPLDRDGRRALVQECVEQH
eukprot:10011605-Alexandrium_andersonii.AAC.1